MKALKLVRSVARTCVQPQFVLSLCAAVAMMASLPAHGQSAVSCESLAKVAVPDSQITLAKVFARGEVKLNEDMQEHKKLAPVPEVCRVQATIRSSSAVEVKAELWLPVKGWNGKLVTATYPGFPVVQHTELIDAAERGYAALMIDGPALDRWDQAGNDAEKLIDYGYRAMHKITVAGKELVKAYYGKPAAKSYFLGCSEGGREGFNEAHHYPEDYDGVIIGGSGHIFAQINAAQLYPAWLATKNPAYALTEEKWKMVHEAVIKGCDELDGVKDGVIENPPACQYDFKQLVCKGAEEAGCVTAPQAEFLGLVFKGSFNARTKAMFFEPPALGAELKVIEFALPEKPMGPAYKLYKSIIFGDDPSWNLSKMDMDQDIAKAEKMVGPALHTEPKDLGAFFKRGGKLIIWDGWNDYNSPYHWINFGKDVEKLYGKKVADTGLKMYFAPGMDHCFGGAGCDIFDKLGAIASFVETGKAPAQMLSEHYEGDQVEHTRPLCQYPNVTRYKGTGDTKLAANWSCVAPKPVAAKKK